MNTLTNIQIDALLKNIKNYKGCFSKDEIRTKLADGYYVINLQDSNDGNGSHWCCLFVSKYFDLYFDSYGFICPENIEQLCDKIIYSEKMLQSLNSSSCGYYVILFIMYMNKFDINDKMLIVKYNNFINLFNNDVNMNDKILKNELSKYNITM
jgi:hypothetical protein